LSYRHSFLHKRMVLGSILTSSYRRLHSLSDSLSRKTPKVRGPNLGGFTATNIVLKIFFILSTSLS
jgi:hypothetical protein